MVYTRRGDRGRTDLASGERVSKKSSRIEAYGTIDELNSVVGLAAAASERKRDELEEIQNELHILQAELSNKEPETMIQDGNIGRLEALIDQYQRENPPLRAFVLSGGCESAARLDVARSVARRAERRIVELDQDEEIREPVLKYTNRLSDLFFVMARNENHAEGVEEKNPDY